MTAASTPKLPPSATPAQSATWADRASRWAVPATCLLLLAQVGPYWYATRDGASYLSIARSIAAGARPSNLGREQLFFAPGYSVLIAPTFWLSEYPFLAISALHALLGIAFMFLCRAWFARLACSDATLLAATCVANASAGIVLRRTLSEALFMPALVAVALLLNHLRAAARDKLPLLLAIAAGLALSALVLTRQAGLMLLPGFGCALLASLWRRELRWQRALIVLALVAVPPVFCVGALGAYERASAGTEARTYADYFQLDAASLANQIVSGLRMRTGEIGRIVIPGMFKASADGGGVQLLNLALYIAVTAVVVRGWWRALRDSQDTLLWATPFYLALYVMWPFNEGIRFLVPLVPVWLLGLYRALPEDKLLRQRCAALLWTLHFVVAAGQWLGDDLPDACHDHARWSQLQELAAAIDHDRGKVGWIPPKTDRQRVMLQYLLDRPVTDLVAAPDKTGDMTWLIVRPEMPPRGFTIWAATDEFGLAERSHRGDGEGAED